jgi:ABC-type antimicrobial peptide transport system permease subunit
VDPDLPVAELRSLEERLHTSLPLRQSRFLTALVSTFAALGLVLAAVGLYSVLDFHLRQRQREMGVRMALGARARHLFTLMLRHGLGLTLLGAAVGTLGAWLLRPLLERFLYRILPILPPGEGGALVSLPSLAAAIAALLGAAVLATLLPAWRATRVDPNTVLRATPPRTGRGN